MKKSVRYEVSFEKSPQYNAVYELQLDKIGGFKYGNGTCVVIRRDDIIIDVVDTRYEVGISEKFEDWCDEFMEVKFNQDLVPHIKKI